MPSSPTTDSARDQQRGMARTASATRDDGPRARRSAAHASLAAQVRPPAYTSPAALAVAAAAALTITLALVFTASAQTDTPRNESAQTDTAQTDTAQSSQNQPSADAIRGALLDELAASPYQTDAVNGFKATGSADELLGTRELRDRERIRVPRDPELTGCQRDAAERAIRACDGCTCQPGSPRAPRSSPPPDLAGALRLILSLLLAAAVLAGVARLFQLFRAGSRRRSSAPAEENELVTQAKQLEHDAVEQLLAEGRYSEALHALMLRGILLVARAQPRPIPAGWTSREIARGVVISDDARRYLTALVARTEPVFFSDREADAADVSAAQADLEALRGLVQAPTGDDSARTTRRTR